MQSIETMQSTTNGNQIKFQYLTSNNEYFPFTLILLLLFIHLVSPEYQFASSEYGIYVIIQCNSILYRFLVYCGNFIKYLSQTATIQSSIICIVIDIRQSSIICCIHQHQIYLLNIYIQSCSCTKIFQSNKMLNKWSAIL